VPPEKYGNAILDSYVLVAATALTRFDVPAGEIATSLLKDSSKFLSAVQRKDSSETIETLVPMTVTYGCLQIHGDKEKVPFQIFIKTPFASTTSC
jgi:hypothetical protein